MSLYSLNKDMLIKLICTIQDDMRKKYEGYHNFSNDCLDKKMNEFDYNALIVNLKNTHYFVEADSFSVHALWVMYVDRPFQGCEKIKYEQISRGFYIGSGNTTINFNFAFIYEKLVCFYYPTSTKIDWKDVEEFLSPFWLREDGSKRRSNASNFHQCILACKNS